MSRFAKQQCTEEEFLLVRGLLGPDAWTLDMLWGSMAFFTIAWAAVAWRDSRRSP